MSVEIAFVPLSYPFVEVDLGTGALCHALLTFEVARTSRTARHDRATMSGFVSR